MDLSLFEYPLILLGSFYLLDSWKFSYDHALWRAFYFQDICLFFATSQEF